MADILDYMADRLQGSKLNEDYSFIDGDTIASSTEVDDNGNPIKYRLAGVDTPETIKYFTNFIKPGTAGSDKANFAMQNLAKKQGFTNVIKTGEYDRRGRELVKLQDAQGRDWEETVLRAGILQPNQYTSNQGLDAYKTSMLLGTDGLGENYDVARNAVAEAIYDETQYDIQLKQLAVDETQLAYGGNYYMPGNVMFRDSRRDLQNKATSPFSTAWDVGLVGAIEGLYGAVELLGETTGWDWAKNVGEAGIARARRKLELQPEIVTSYKDINGFFGKEGFLQYVANNAAISLPYMAATIGGALASPYVGATALGVAATGAVLTPVALYTGTIWNEQEGDNKNPYLAVAGGVSQAVLDRVGLKFLGATKLLSKEGTEEVAQRLVDSPNFNFTNTTEAKNYLLGLARLETAKLSEDAARFAKDQLRARNVARYGLKRIGVAAAGEGATEALQEAIGYTASHAANGFRDWNANEFKDRLIDASIAGTTLGGGIAMPGGIMDYGAWVDIAYRTGPDTGRQTSEMGRLAQQDMAENNGRQFNIQEENEKVRNETFARKTEAESIRLQLATANLTPESRAELTQRLPTVVDEDINVKKKRHEKYKLERTLPALLRDWWKILPGAALKGQTRQYFERLLGDSKTARIEAEALGGTLERSTSGETYENKKHLDITELKYTFGDISEILAMFGQADSRAARQKFSNEYYDQFKKAKAKADAERRDINWETDLDPEFQPKANAFSMLFNKMQALGDKIYYIQAKHNPELGYIENYLSRKKTLDKLAIENDRAGFETALLSIKKEVVDPSTGEVTEVPMFTANQAAALTDAILMTDGADIPSDFMPEGGFSVTSPFTFRPQSHKERTLNLADRDEFAPFMEQDLFTNVSNAAKSAVRYSVLEEYVGSNNEKINFKLAKIQKELEQSGKYTAEEAQAEVDRLAYDLVNYYDSESGNYKRNIPPVLRYAQQNILFVTTATSLPFATVSNLPELGLTSLGLNREQIFGKKGSINSIGKSFVDEFKNTANRLYGRIANQPAPHKRGEAGHAIAKRLGFFEFEVGAAHTTGVSETGRWRQRLLDVYFKAILLQQWTNAARAARAGIALDYIVDKVAIAVAAKNAGVATNESREAEEALRNLGIDQEFIVRYHTDQENNNRFLRDPQRSEVATAKWQRMIDAAMFNFVNDAVALPQAANRPLIYQDPRFALFFQFQGFIATFTANHIPKMWNQMAKRGTPAMKYNVFAAASTLILLGFVSQHLKDLLKFGETTPYFKGMEYVRRGVGASGLLGTYERAIDFVFPMYDQRYKTNTGWFFGNVVGESAGVSKAVRIADLGFDVTTGEKPPETLAKISPFTQAILQQTRDLPQWSFGE